MGGQTLPNKPFLPANRAKNLLFSAFLLFIVATAPLFAQVNIQIHREVLPNGLTVLLWENPQAPVVASRLFYTTGSVHEVPGQTGIAHMLEHMLFKGTKKVGITDSIQDMIYIQKLDSLHALIQTAENNGDSLMAKGLQSTFDSVLTEHRKLFVKNELWETYLREGGTGLNAYTSRLMTAYFVTLPKNKVDLFLWLESDRMQNAVLREFYPERDVIMEERRMRVDDRPTGRYFEGLQALFYEAHPYRTPVIGWASDIAHFTREETWEYYRKYYKPNNAILVFSGDFDTEILLPKIRQYFGSIPRGEDFKPIHIKEPEQDSEKRMIHYRSDAKPRYDLQFHTPAIGHPDLYALDIIEGVLNGRSGRLYKRLVEEEKLATAASAGNGMNKYISEFYVSVQLPSGVDPTDAENIVWDEIDKLQKDLISPRELQKVKNQAYASSVRALEELETVATRLAYYEMYGDWTLINTYPEKLRQVTAEDVRKVAQKYFHRSKATTGILIPEPGEEKQ